jgi:nonsense-mediated mRNA decay protein 3
MERDFEMFLRDVEEDEELRAGLALYKAEQERQAAADAMEVEESELGEEDHGLEIPMEQLLDDFEDMTMHE